VKIDDHARAPWLVLLAVAVFTRSGVWSASGETIKAVLHIDYETFSYTIQPTRATAKRGAVLPIQWQVTISRVLCF
jgi:hypothetical protein